MNYNEYISFYKNTINNLKCFEDGCFIIHKDNKQKITKEGKLRYYDGDTIIFNLPNNLKDECSRIQNILYDKLSDILSVKLSRKNFHMTAHQLYNPYKFNFGKLESKEKLKKMNNNYEKYKKIMLKYDKNIKIKVKIFSVYFKDTRDIAVMLLPSDEKSYLILKKLYKDFENILCFGKEMGYMHITLAYYKPLEKIDINKSKKLNEVINSIKFSNETFEISLNDLNYVRFTNMDDFHTI